MALNQENHSCMFFNCIRLQFWKYWHLNTHKAQKHTPTPTLMVSVLLAYFVAVNYEMQSWVKLKIYLKEMKILIYILINEALFFKMPFLIILCKLQIKVRYICEICIMDINITMCDPLQQKVPYNPCYKLLIWYEYYLVISVPFSSQKVQHNRM